MKITINSVAADIQPETEKNVGEILCALDTWLAGTGHRLSGISIDGETVSADSMEACFGRDIETIDTLDISTSAILDLYAESLAHTMEDIAAYEAAGFEEKSLFAGEWQHSPQALLLAEQSPDLHDWAVKAFSGEGRLQAFRLIVEERFHELQDPAAEMSKTGSLVGEVCARLEELSLDIQTGKDARAAETVRTFSGVTEKVFRVFNVLRMKGFPVEQAAVENTSISAYIGEFSTALRELLAAYEQHDTVLVGDLAEYEMAPRLRNLHAAIMNATIGGDQ